MFEYNGDYESYVCFVFKEKTIIGKITLAEVNGEVFSTFDYGSFESINDAFLSKTPVTFLGYGNSLIMQSESELITINGFVSENILESSLLLYNDNVLITEIEEDIYKSALPIRGSHILLDVKLTDNYESYLGGLCWAACTASKVRYHYGNKEIVYNVDLSRSVGANNVYKEIQKMGLYYPDSSHTLIGYNLFNVNINYTNSMSAQSVYNTLMQNKPIHIGIRTSDNLLGHDVIISGVTFNATGGTYYIMDPNISYIRSVPFGLNAVTSGNYFSMIGNDGVYYNNWVHSRS